MNQAVISVGSNIDPETNIARARSLVALRLRLLGESEFVRTAPVGFAGQPDFLNGAFLVATELDRAGLQDSLKEIERELGRTRIPNRYGPRTIDLDIVIWNGQVVDSDFHEREFVRKACCELLPGLESRQPENTDPPPGPRPSRQS